MGNWKIATRVVQSGSEPWIPAAGEHAHVPPLYQTANFEYPDASAAEAAAVGRAYLYTREGNPTCDLLASAVAALEGAEAGIAFASGMGAMSASLFAYARAGDHVLASEAIYGGTTDFVARELPKAGVEHSFVPTWDTDAVRRALRPNTRVLVTETITNPLLRVPDLAALGTLCRERGIALIVDSTFATPICARPLELGATVVMHSATKYLAGHGDVVAGIAVGSTDAVERLRRMRSTFGAVLDPFAAWLTLRGLKTLALRVERQCASAHRIATALGGVPGVERVYYPLLGSHPDVGRARRLLEGGGGMVTFEVSGGGAAARRVYDRLKLVRRAASLGDVVSLMTHPATFSHHKLTDEERSRFGISEGLLRLSVGIEDPDDIVADLRQAISD